MLQIGRNDALLVEALRLNDSLQSLLLKHDSLVSRSSLPPEKAPAPAPAPPILSLPLPPAPSMSWQFDAEKEEEEEDGFSALAKRLVCQLSHNTYSLGRSLSFTKLIKLLFWQEFYLHINWVSRGLTQK